MAEWIESGDLKAKAIFVAIIAEIQFFLELKRKKARENLSCHPILHHTPVFPHIMRHVILLFLLMILSILSTNKPLF
ncbi:hypothetical protein [Yersinia ruckeri]|uniref:hypothetical protein n=1 Tax=Yersinia ruckeri TaxID=29486 RepID=UPI00223703ED|nr:hypothetical protein [Yersinia ruckeri]MCW6568112.1 hypothetical protein [Yersinia ruckeri]